MISRHNKGAQERIPDLPLPEGVVERSMVQQYSSTTVHQDQQHISTSVPAISCTSFLDGEFLVEEHCGGCMAVMVHGLTLVAMYMELRTPINTYVRVRRPK